MNDYDNCKAKIYIDNVIKDQDGMKENIKELYGKNDAALNLMHTNNEKLSNKMTGLFIGLFSSSFILLLTVILTKVLG